jgi:hypothetical protein
MFQDGKTIFDVPGKVMTCKVLSYHTLHVRSKGGFTHKAVEVILPQTVFNQLAANASPALPQSRWLTVGTARRLGLL